MRRLTKLLVASQLFDIADEGTSKVSVRDKRHSRPACQERDEHRRAGS